jgi:hypothetical protein
MPAAAVWRCTRCAPPGNSADYLAGRRPSGSMSAFALSRSPTFKLSTTGPGSVLYAVPSIHHVAHRGDQSRVSGGTPLTWV